MQTTEQGADAGGSAHLFAYTVREFDAPDGKKARAWTRIGVAFPHKDGTGFNVELHSLPLDGRITAGKICSNCVPASLPIQLFPVRAARAARSF